MKNQIFFNPKCSNCRDTLAILQNEGADVPIVEYLKDPPNEKELAEVCKLLGMRPYDLVRQKEPIFEELQLSKIKPDDDGQWYRLLAQHPNLLQRPIVVYEGKAAVCRPPENVRKLL